MKAKNIFSQVQPNTASGIDLNVNILTMGYWPTYVPIDVLLPNEVLLFSKSFLCRLMTFNHTISFL